MNNREFNQWKAFHVKLFGEGLAKALSDLEVLATWQSVLEFVPLADAMEATRRMIGDDELQPQAWHKHPATIKRISYNIRDERAAKQPQRKFVNGEEVYDCGTCCDTGFVLILSPQFVEAYRRGLVKREPFDVPKGSIIEGHNNWRWGHVNGHPPSMMAVACTCVRGKPDNFNGAKFDPDRHYCGDVPNRPDELQRFDEFVQSLDDMVPTNYVSDFDAFNEG